MAKKKLFKSKGNFTIKRLHQSGNYGKIFERDYTTVSNTYSNSSGQIPIYTSPSFKLTVRGGINEQKKYHSSNWINNPQSCNPSNSNIWTLACMPTPNNDDSKIVLIGSPRIPHPPMDIILAIHFIILNFVNSKEYPAKEHLLSDESYIDVIERAQKRVLDPYFNAINGDGHTVFTKENLFPLYV